MAGVGYREAVRGRRPSPVGFAAAVAAGFANTRNWSSTSLTKWAAAVARVRAGTGRARLVGVGDSTMAGFLGGTVFANGRSLSGLANVASQFATLYGVPVNTNWILGAGVQSTPPNVIVFDPRISYTGSPTVGTGSFGGLMFNLTASGQSWSYALAQSDTIEFYYATNTGLGTFGLYIDGTLYNTYNTSATASTAKVVVTGLSDTTHTVQIQWVSGNNYFIGVGGYRSTVPAIDVLNGGYSGSTSTTWASAMTGYNPGGAWKTLGADLSFIDLGINDREASSDPTTYGTNMTTLVNAGRASPINGDVILIVPNPTGATQLAFEAKLQTVSDTLTAPLFDFQSLGVDYATMNAAGRMGDTLHPKAVGYTYLWVPVAQAVQGIVP